MKTINFLCLSIAAAMSAAVQTASAAQPPDTVQSDGSGNTYTYDAWNRMVLFLL